MEQRASNLSMPLVTVVIPSYNCARYLPEAINSVLAQTYRPIEVIVVDDGSTDNTAELATAYGNKIIYIKQENRGLSAARNTGILSSSGKYLVFLDSDDFLLPDMVEVMVRALEEHPECGVAYGGYLIVDEDGSRQSESDLTKPSGRILEKVVTDGLTIVPSVMVRRDALSVSGIFDPMLPQIEDLDLWLRLAYYYDFVFVPKHVSAYRSVYGSMSRNWKERKVASRLVVKKAALFFAAKGEPGRLVRVFRRNIFSHRHKQCVQDAFVHYWAGRYRLAAKTMLRGVLIHPQYLANRGVVAILIKSLVRWFGDRYREDSHREDSHAR
jgi:glycosyltransferase involved in cell wall biosynthesis